MKKIVLSSLAAILLAGTALQAEPSSDYGVNNTSGPIYKRVKHTDSFGDTYYTYTKTQASQKVRKEIGKHRLGTKAAPREIVAALQETIEAIDALQKKKKELAIDHLKNADRLFTKALKANPQLKLVPVDRRIDVYEYLGDSESIKKTINEATKMLHAYQTQDARELLEPLRDEIDIVTRLLPMDLYPAATKKAIEALKKGDEKSALETLVTATGTIVDEVVVVPVPLLSAQELIEAASKMERTDKKNILRHLNAAKEELHKALLLGYTSRHSEEYKSLYGQLKKVAAEVKAGHETQTLFEKLKKSLQSLLGKTRNEKRHAEEIGKSRNGHRAAQEEETEDKLRFEEQMQSDVF